MKLNPLSMIKKTFRGIIHSPRALLFSGKTLVGSVVYTTNFFVLLLLYLTIKIAHRVGRLPFIPRPLLTIFRPFISTIYARVVAYSRYKDESINRVNLIDMALRNMTFKKTRTLITVGGMVIGIAAIVFLVSIGYGLQELVITRVARLDELKQVSVSTQTGSNVAITDETIADFKNINGVEHVLPLIAVVGRVNYQNSVTDMAVYGVTKSYLEQSAIKTIKGTVFESNDLVSTLPADTVGDIAGVEDTQEIAVMGDKIRDVSVYIEPDSWLKVRKGPDTSAAIVGYTRRTEGAIKAEEVWGSDYDQADEGKAGTDKDGKPMGKWIKASVYLWKLQACEESNPDCAGGKYVVIRGDDDMPRNEVGYFAQLSTSVNQVAPSEGAVLAEMDDVLAEVDESESSESGTQWVDIASESAALTAQPVKTVQLGSTAKRQAVVNRAMLQVLGINENEAVGKTFSTSFVVIGEVLEGNDEKVESAPADYTIVGVIPEDQTPFFYVPFIDLRGLGITNFTQLKVAVQDASELPTIRQQIEGYGYVTSSVADTVAQINSLFATARIVLALLGMVALGVSALGMFNTLTVSLLERTREVGLMKAMGMRSTEVQELFLTESMTMGFFGGVVGILVGFIMGKLLGVLISAFALFKGVGFIDISHIPWFFVVVVIFLSIVVGVLTGIYPARRAKRISALDALRYE